MKSKNLINDFSTNGQTATNSKSNHLSDWEATDIIQFSDECSANDKDFYEMFTTRVFRHFGWKYYGKEKQE